MSKEFDLEVESHKLIVCLYKQKLISIKLDTCELQDGIIKIAKDYARSLLPEKKDSTLCDDYNIGYEDGWDECVEEIQSKLNKCE